MFVSFRHDIFLNHVHTKSQSSNVLSKMSQTLNQYTDLKGMIRPELNSKEDTLKVLFEMC